VQILGGESEGVGGDFLGDEGWECVRSDMNENINTILSFDFEGEKNENSNGDLKKTAVPIEGGYVYYFEKTDAYRLAIDILEEVYKLSTIFPKEERYGLVDQIRRASVSVASNIAEGYGRDIGKGRNQFFTYSYASALEVYCQLEIALRLNYLVGREKSYADLRKKIQKLTYIISATKHAKPKVSN
jgi:four helix bundle protein